MNRKRVLIISPPFQGHLHPLLRLAQGVREVADVLVMSTPGAQKECDLPFRPLLAAQEPLVWQIAEPGLGVKNHPLRLWRQLKQNVALMGEMKREIDTAMREEKPHLVLADFTVPVAGLAAMQQGIPWWTAIASPCVIESPDGPPAYFGGQTPDGNALLHAAMRFGTRVFKKTMFRLFRKEFRALGFDHLYREDGSEAVYSPQRILALGMREIEFPQTWPSQLHFIGPVLHTPPFHGEEPTFDERPHVLVTLGTHLPHAKAALARRVREIAKRHPGLVFHFTHGKTGSAPTATTTENFHELAYISYARHLPRYALVVHHAGSGILNHCLRHAVPAVAHPQDFDQFDNAARLAFAGAALVEKNAGHLESAILRALSDEPMRRRCQVLSQTAAIYDAPATVREMVRDFL